MTCFVIALTISPQELAESFWSHFPPRSLQVSVFIGALHTDETTRRVSSLRVPRGRCNPAFPVGHPHKMMLGTARQTGVSSPSRGRMTSWSDAVLNSVQRPYVEAT